MTSYQEQFNSDGTVHIRSSYYEYTYTPSSSGSPRRPASMHMPPSVGGSSLLGSPGGSTRTDRDPATYMTPPESPRARPDSSLTYLAPTNSTQAAEEFYRSRNEVSGGRRDFGRGEAGHSSGRHRSSPRDIEPFTFRGHRSHLRAPESREHRAGERGTNPYRARVETVMDSTSTIPMASRPHIHRPSTAPGQDTLEASSPRRRRHRSGSHEDATDGPAPRSHSERRRHRPKADAEGDTAENKKMKEKKSRIPAALRWLGVSYQ